MHCIEFFPMVRTPQHGPRLSNQITPYGDGFAQFIRKEVLANVHDTLGLRGHGETAHYGEEASYRYRVSAKHGFTQNRIGPLAEIIALSTLAFPQPNEWLQGKVNRSVIGKSLVKPTDEYVNAQSDYMREHYPNAIPTRNIRVLAPLYALHIAACRAIDTLYNPEVKDYEKTICALPFAVATQLEVPLDFVLLDPAFKQHESMAIADGIIKRIDRENLTDDQKSLLVGILFILTGEGAKGWIS